MRLLFVADGRSSTALSWIQTRIDNGHETHLVSTYSCEPPAGLASFHILPAAFSGMSGTSRGGAGVPNSRGFVRRFRKLLLPARYYLGPLSLSSHQSQFKALIAYIQPDLIHALRIPFEGMLATVAPGRIPLVISIWGNDLTLHAKGSFLMGNHTRKTLRRADSLIADAARDIRLGGEWGFAADKPTLIVPGGGGVRLDEIAKSRPECLPEELADAPIIINPRGQRPGSLRQDVFFQSIPLVLENIPEALFICPNLAGDTESEGFVKSLGIQANTKLWPHLSRGQMWTLLKKARVFVSPSIHDGTPNSLLEAMACGVFPVVGNIESMQEWISPGINGMLIDATSPHEVALGIIGALKNPTMLADGKIKNAHIIAERAGYERCTAMVEAFYTKIKRGALPVAP
jgi:glycosyltransferase involved in cell wall biosynthesis